MPKHLLSLPGGHLDLERGEADIDGTRRRLTPNELLLVRRLVSCEGTPVDRSALSQEVLGYAPTAQTRAVQNAVSRLRQKIERDPGNPSVLVTTADGAYLWVATHPTRLEPGTAEREAAVMLDDDRPLVPPVGRTLDAILEHVSPERARALLLRCWDEMDLEEQVVLRAHLARFTDEPLFRLFEVEVDLARGSVSEATAHGIDGPAGALARALVSERAGDAGRAATLVGGLVSEGLPVPLAYRLHYRQAVYHARAGRLLDAELAFERAAGLHTSRRAQFLSLDAAAAVRLMAGQPLRARPFAERAASLARDTQDPLLRHRAHQMLGRIALADARHEQAESELVQALTIAQEIGTLRLVAPAHLDLVALALDRGDLRTAEGELGRAEVAALGLGEPRLLLALRINLALLSLVTGDLPAALDHCMMARTLGGPYVEAQIRRSGEALLCVVRRLGGEPLETVLRLLDSDPPEDRVTRAVREALCGEAPTGPVSDVLIRIVLRVISKATASP